MELREYLDQNGVSPFEKWFGSINRPTAAKVTLALTRLRRGNTGPVKSLGGGVHELKIHFGPGYRVYFANYGDEIVVLLAGGSKKRQSQDIDKAKARWKVYKTRKG